MKTYQFSQEQLSPVMVHIAAYQIIVLSLSPQNNNYVTELDCNELPPGEYEHLNEQYGFEEIV